MEPAQQPGVSFRVLGTVEAARDGRPIALGGPRQRALLALLLLEPGRPVSTGRLSDELWAGEPPEGADATLRSYVSRLRTALGAHVPLQASSDGYSLHVDPHRIDARRFEAGIRAGDEALLRRRTRDGRGLLAQALELWGGRPYGELSGDGSLRNEAERLAELRLHALERRIEADLDLGLASELVDELESAVRDHPFRERLWRHLMLALYRAGRQADALGAYGRARDQLDEHLGIAPGEDLEALQLQVLRQEVPAARGPAGRHNIPSSLTRFIGRAAEIARVVDATREHRLVTLTGVGGVGKTRLSQEAARRVAEEHPDGVWFVDLAPLADPELVAGHLGTVLDLREVAGVDPIDRLVAGLQGQEVLLLLDNCEHLREACAGVAQRLLAGLPGVRILATSRELLGIPGEVELPVQPLRLPASTDPAATRASDAVALLLDRARSARPDLRTDDEALLVAAQIVQDLDGLPLAIELAAARARALSLGDIAARLDDRFKFLVSWRRLAPARHRTLREAMDWSFELLGAPERSVLARLAVFAGGFDLPAVTAICADGDEDAALRALERLVDASLLVPAETPTGIRYGLLETVRQYAAERLAEAGEVDGARLAHARYFADWVESIPVQGAGQAAGFARIDDEVENLRSALETAASTGNVELELGVSGKLWRFWQVRGHLAEGTSRLEHALSRLEAPATQGYGRALTGAGILAWVEGRYDRGVDAGNALLDLASHTNDAEAAYSGTRLLGMVALRRRDFEATERWSRQSIELGRRLGPPHDPLIDELNYAVVLLDWGRPEEAVERLQAVLVGYTSSGSPEGIGLARLNLGEAAAFAADWERAREHFVAAEQAFTVVGFRAHVGHALAGLAAVEAATGNVGEAARQLGRANALLEAVGSSDDDFAPGLVRQAEATARAALGDAAYAEAFEAGRRR